MSATNDVTGDNLVSKASNANYRDNYDATFGKKPEVIVDTEDDIELSELPEEDDDEPYCHNCSGSGEGMWDGSTCSVCHGYGHVRADVEDDYT